MRSALLAVAVATSAPSGASAAETIVDKSDPAAGFTLRMSFLEEIIRTSNALDGTTAISDTIIHMRGTLEAERQTDIGQFGLSAALEAFEFDEIDFESDRFAALGVSYARAFGDRFALRGTLDYAYEDQGDDIDLGVFILGTRTATHTVSGAVEATARLDPATVLTVALTNSYDAVGKSEFTIDLPALRLSPDLNAAGAEAVLNRTIGKHTVGLLARANAVSLHGEVPEASAFASQTFTLAARAETAAFADLELSGEFGLAYMRDALDITDEIYPVAALAAARTFAAGTTARLALNAYVDTLDSDDPLGSYVQRAEFELSQPLPYRLTLSGGVFGELRRNFFIANEEEAAGVYVALAHDPTANLSLLLRVDYDERYRSLIETRERTLSGQFGLQVRL